MEVARSKTPLASSDERTILLTVARVGLSSEYRGKLEQLLKRGPDWDDLLPRARIHGLLPLLHWHTSSLPGELVPDRVREYLLRYFHGNNIRQVLLTTELVRLVSGLSSRGVRTLPFKGIAIANAVYGNPALRQPGDIDILIRPEDSVVAREYLVESGFDPHFPSDLDVAQERALARYGYGRTYFHARKNISIDLHWNLLPRWFGDLPGFSELWARSKTIALQGKAIQVFSTEDLAAYLCLHGAKHEWSNLKWVIDLAELLRANPSLDWKQVSNHVSARKPMIWYGLALAHELFDARLPTDIERIIHSDGFQQRPLVEEAKRRLLSKERASADRRQNTELQRTLRSFDSRLCGSGFRGNVLRRSLILLANPSPVEIESVSLPETLFPLYYAIRAIRLTRRAALGVSHAVASKLAILQRFVKFDGSHIENRNQRHMRDESIRC